MSFSAHKALEESNERHEHAIHGNPKIAITAAIIAVLAALSTMLSNHYSVGALNTKNEAILQMSRASDTYAYYESKRIKFHIYSAIVAADIAKSPDKNRKLGTVATTEQKAAIPILKNAQNLEEESRRNDEGAEHLLQSYEMLEVTTTLLEVAIVFVSISALTGTSALLYLGGCLSVAAILYGAYALLHSA